jgi:outer membrane immunogenic protein
MMKTMVLGVLMASAAAGVAQESRMDASMSVTTVIMPQVNSNGIQVNATKPIGFLGSYRYMLTPRSALEANYTFSQNNMKYNTNFQPNIRIHTRQQEISLAYVYSLNFKNFSPFAEAGVGATLFSPINDFQTNQFSAKRNTNLGGLFGVGVAYELSPSFDIRAEYRGFVTKTPDFGLPGDIIKTNRYTVFMYPAVGVAYHF